MENQQDLYEKGIDLSKWQGTVDWEKVAADGIQHVFIKMSEGGDHTDPKFYENWHAAKNAGLKVNAYHYFRALTATEEQVTNIKKNLDSVGFDPNSNLLAIDVEQRGNENASKDEMTDSLHDLLSAIKQVILSDNPLFIYCSPNIWNNTIHWEKYDFSIYSLWIADWNAEKPDLPQTWQKPGLSWSWWQYSSEGEIDGIDGPVDLDWVRKGS